MHTLAGRRRSQQKRPARRRAGHSSIFLDLQLTLYSRAATPSATRRGIAVGTPADAGPHWARGFVRRWSFLNGRASGAIQAGAERIALEGKEAGPKAGLERKGGDAGSVREVKPQRDRQEDGHLPASHRLVRTIGSRAAPSGDPRGSQRFHEPEERVRGGERRWERSRRPGRGSPAAGNRREGRRD
jgi:hypothetical protein